MRLPIRSSLLRTATGVVLVLAAPTSAFAQDSIGTPITIGQSFRIASKALGETRVFDVSLPADYPSSTERYPLLIVLDGESLHETAAALTSFYASTAILPPTIVVGVRNTHRSRDLTPPAAAGFTAPSEMGGSGGAGQFLAFLADELIPHLERKYRTAPFRVLIGHSLGGLFALSALGQRPGVFNGYVVMEPATWWNEGKEIRAARAALAAAGASRTRLVFVNTPDPGFDTTQWGGAAPMVRFRSTNKGETHASMPPTALRLALGTMFEDFRPTAWRPGTRPIAMLDRYDSLAARIGYPVSIPELAFAQSIRMSIHARFFADAERSLHQMERAFGNSSDVKDLRAQLAEERAAPAPANLIPLNIPAVRPSARTADRFLGTWALVGDSAGHTIEVRASGDTIVVHSRVRLGSSDWDEADRPVIQMTSDGRLEWGLEWFRGIAALLVLRGELLTDGTMRVTREPRGWVPRGPGNLNLVEVFRRVGAR